MNLTEREFSKKLVSLTGENPRVLVAFSGGCDSLGLLALCSKTLPKENVKAVYVNHNLRGPAELEAETELNCYNCDLLHVPLIIREIPRFSVAEYAEEKRCGTEAAARILRYGILEEERLKTQSDFILTAHHQDDQVETIFMKKIQGSPLASLRGIAEVTGHVVRPLLDFSKEQIEHYVEGLGLSWSTDSTNSDNSILRNKIRNQLLPKEVAADKTVIDRLLSLRQEVIHNCEAIKMKVENPLDNEAFKELTTEQKEVVLFELWDRVVGTARGLSKDLISRVVKTSLAGAGLTEASGGRFEVCEGKLYLSSVAEDSVYSDFIHPLEPCVKLPGNMKLFVGQKEPSERPQDDLILDESLFKGKVYVRFVREGDRISLVNGSKTVLKLLKDMKIPSGLRLRVPVLAEEDAVIAVFASAYGGRNRIDRRFSGRPGTRFVLIVKEKATDQ